MLHSHPTNMWPGQIGDVNVRDIKNTTLFVYIRSCMVTRGVDFDYFWPGLWSKKSKNPPWGCCPWCFLYTQRVGFYISHWIIWSFISINEFTTTRLKYILGQAIKLSFLTFGKIALSLNYDSFLHIRANYIKIWYKYCWHQYTQSSIYISYILEV